MANLLQLSCPKCSTQLRVPRPAGTTGKAKCGKCSHTFTFRVSQPAADSPSVPAAQPAPAVPEDPFGALPDLGNLPGVQASPLPHPTLGSAAAQARKNHAPKRALKSAKRGPAVPIAIASLAVMLVMAIGVGGWTLLGKAKLIPTSMMIFDSGKEVLADTDKSDLELLRLIKSIEGETVPQETVDKVTETVIASKQLPIRALRLSLMTEQEAIELTGVPSQPQDSDDAGYFREEKPAPEGPIDDDAKEIIREKLAEIPREKRMVLVWGLGQGFGNAEFVREYLRYGHLRAPEPMKRGEQIAAKQVELIRKAAKMGIGYAEKIDIEQIEAFQKEGEELGPDKIQQYVWGLFSPIDKGLSEIGDELFDLAEERHGLDPDDVGDLKPYKEINRFAILMIRHIYGSAISTYNGQVKTFAGLDNLLAGSQDLDAANRGLLPSRLAEKIRENQPSAEELNLQFEQQKQAMQKQADELRAKNQQLAEQKRQQEAAKMAAARAKADAGNSNSITSNNQSPLAPPERSAMNDDNGRGPTIGSPFGPRPGGLPSGLGQGRRFRGPQAGSQSGPGPTGMRGPGGSGSGQRSRPEFDPTTGVTIVMNDAGNISTKDIAGKFVKTLQVGSQVNISNGKLTVRLSYTGPIDTVTKLIDFGKVVSADEQTRKIIVEPN